MQAIVAPDNWQIRVVDARSRNYLGKNLSTGICCRCITRAYTYLMSRVRFRYAGAGLMRAPRKTNPPHQYSNYCKSGSNPDVSYQGASSARSARGCKRQTRVFGGPVGQAANGGRWSLADPAAAARPFFTASLVRGALLLLDELKRCCEGPH